MKSENNFVHNAINLKNVSVAPILQDINLAVIAGSILGITGRKGSGKTLLLRCIHLLAKPISGIVHVNGSDLCTLKSRDLKAARRNIGMISANTVLYNQYTVANNITIVLKLLDTHKNLINAKVQELLSFVGLKQYAHTYPHSLNKFQAKCLNIAMAIANSPRVLLCDDITSGLDTTQAEHILNILEKIKRQFHTTIVLATRDIHTLKTICDNYAILDHGRIIAQGPIIQAFTQINAKGSNHILKSIARADLPTAIKRTLKQTSQENTVPVVKIIFADHLEQELIITQLIQTYKVKINIIQAHLDYLREHKLGIMLIHLMGEPQDISCAINFLQQKNIYVEELGYASNPIITN